MSSFLPSPPLRLSDLPQVRVSTFSTVVSCLSECMAVRHLDPSDELWRSASAAFVTVVQSGLPSINITTLTQQQHPEQYPGAAHAARAFARGAAAAGRPAVGGRRGWPGEGGGRTRRGLWLGAGARRRCPRTLGRCLRRRSRCSCSASTSRRSCGRRGIRGVPTSLRAAAGRPPPPPPAPEPGGPSDFEVQAAVVDCLSDTVLSGLPLCAA